VNEGDDTLTESCEGAVSLMVIEIRLGSLQKLPFGEVVEDGRLWDGLGRRLALYHKSGFCFLSRRLGSAEMLVDATTSQDEISGI